VVRLGWKGRGTNTEQVGPRRLTAVVLAGRRGQVPAEVEFSMPLMVVPPFFVLPDSGHLDAGTLTAGGSSQLECLVWSPTRAAFDLVAEETTNDPCFKFTVSEPLPASELVPERLGLATRTPVVRGARRVKIIISEQSGENRLPLGPIQRRVRLKLTGAGHDPPDPLNLTVGGWVRGEVQVGTAADKDQVDLGDFYSNLPATRTIQIKAKRPDVKLSHDPKQSSLPDGVEVSLKPGPAEDGKPTWHLTVSVPPNTLSGALPPRSVVVLTIDGQPPRQVRVPVVGIATRK
jgi:hypothetical protein